MTNESNNKCEDVAVAGGSSSAPGAGKSGAGKSDAGKCFAETLPAKRAAGPKRVGSLKVYGAAGAVFAILLGMFAGAATFTFGYGKGASYLSNDPETCINCHVMQGHMDSWQNSSHHHVAVCNDCHLPHDFIGKWVTKADNGFFHSLAFTLQNYHDPIRIKPRNARVAQGSCIHCHKDVVHAMLPLAGTTDMLSCVHCHQDVGHVLR